MIRQEPVNRRTISARRRLYRIHAWLGFHLAVIMAIVLLTGTIAVVSNEIDWLIRRDMRVSPDGDRASWGQMQSAAEAYAPESTIVSLTDMGGDHFAFRARMVDPYGRHMFVHVSQWTGEVTGQTHPLTVQRVFRDLHRYLFMPRFIGLPLVTSLAFVLAMSLYTGLRTSRNWRTLMFRVRTDKGVRIFLGDAHKAVGLWSIWFFLVIIVTGIWYLLEYGAAVSGNSIQAPRAKVSKERVSGFGMMIPRHNSDDIIGAALAVFPGVSPTSIRFPSRATDAIEVHGSVGNPFIRDRANRVFLDPADLSVIEVQEAGEIGWASYLNEMADPLHFGVFGGLPTKLVWFVFGVFMTGLSFTGVWLTWKRIGPVSLSRVQVATLPVLVFSLYFCTLWYDRLQGPLAPVSEADTQDIRFDGAQARARIALTEHGAPTGLVRVEVSSDEGRPNLSGLRLSLLVPSGDIIATTEQMASALRRVTEFRAAFSADDIEDASALVAQLTFGDSTIRDVVWKMPLATEQTSDK